LAIHLGQTAEKPRRNSGQRGGIELTSGVSATWLLYTGAFGADVPAAPSVQADFLFSNYTPHTFKRQP